MRVTYGIVRHEVEQQHQPGMFLGRHLELDARSLAFEIEPQTTAIKPAEWLAPIPTLNQGDLGSCHDDQTEVLTENGWCRFADLQGHERLASVDPSTNTLIYERPTRLVQFPYSGKMICASNESLDFRVTPDHMMLVRKWDERKRTLRPDYELVAAKDLGWYSGLLNRVAWAGDGASDTYTLPGVDHKHKPQRTPRDVPMAAWLRFLGLFVAEGTLLTGSRVRDGRTSTPYKIQIAAYKDREKAFARQVFADLGVAALELRDRFTFENRQIYEALQGLGFRAVRAPQKVVPQFVFRQKAEHIRDFLLGHFMGDGSEQEGMRAHYTSSAQLADDLQRLIFLSGDETRISVRAARPAQMTADGRVVQGNYPEHRVSVCSTKHLSVERKRQVFEDDYEGIVYCAEVPTHHTLVTRRNAKVLVSGNCTGNAGTRHLAQLYGTDLASISLDNLILGTDADEDETFAVEVYHLATIADGFPGTYPPDDSGSSGLGVCRALKAEKLISSYHWATNARAFATLLQRADCIMGMPWYKAFFSPDKNGFIDADPAWARSGIAGGHEVCVEALEAWDDADPSKSVVRVHNSWGDSWGDQGCFRMRLSTYETLKRQIDIKQFVR